ncbi:hypothetical protein ENBRE01_0527 [Enteropsectra breve]|nr:hypothetical protein ENBRE01_0527 [Enteropsectra breve]
MDNDRKRLILDQLLNTADDDLMEYINQNIYSSKRVFKISNGDLAPPCIYSNPVEEMLFGPQACLETVSPPECCGDSQNCYVPSATRGKGPTKEAFCRLCRGWFRMKNSSYWYHMNYIHGINKNGKRIPEPVLRKKHSALKENKDKKYEGFCKECGKWLVLGNTEKGIKFGWYKHWQREHSKSKTI